MTVKTGSASDVSFGASGQYGVYDPHDRFSYLILGGDLVDPHPPDEPPHGVSPAASADGHG